MKYLLAFFGEESRWEEVTPEQMREGMKRWEDYTQSLLDAGAHIAGEGLKESSTATTVKLQGDERIVTDGPFAETKEQLGGFYLIDVENLDEAIDWAKRVPLMDGMSTEVRPVMDYSETGYEDPAAKAQAGA
jgi:hypothetical protein